MKLIIMLEPSDRPLSIETIISWFKRMTGGDKVYLGSTSDYTWELCEDLGADGVVKLPKDFV